MLPMEAEAGRLIAEPILAFVVISTVSAVISTVSAVISTAGRDLSSGTEISPYGRNDRRGK